MINRKYLPSKKFLIALSIAVAVILIAIIFNYWKPNITKYKNPDLATNTNASSSFIEIDSDNDGLADWKENLYGTNPKNADSDGDKTSDLDEISQNRDPLKANTAPAEQEPNDKIDAAIIERNQKILEEYEKLSETDKFSRNLLSNIIASQPVSGSMDQNTMDSILAKAMGEIPQRNYAGITKVTDLNLLKTDSTNLNENMTAYVNSFRTETQKLIPILGSDINIINSYIDGSTNTKSEMLKLTNKYQAIVNNLIKMPVPVVIGYYDINYHLEVINDLEQ
ncbi:MAG: hypothetical protein ABIF22_00655, partial [bacterium]